MINDLEKEIDEIANRLKSGHDISAWQKDHNLAPIASLLSKLASFPKAKIPTFDSDRVKNQVLDRISVPADMAMTEKAGFWASVPYILKLVSGIAGTLLIVVSLGIGTAVAALQSVPGQPIYPLKKIVESVELNLTQDPSAKANLQIQFASNRLDELTTVLAQSQAGEISTADTQKIVTQTISDLQQSTAAALSSSTSKTDNNSQPQVSNLTKLVDLSNKQVAVLQPLVSAASVGDDGEVTSALQQALQSSIDSKAEAVKNVENAGLKIEDQPIDITAPVANQASANGQITALTSDSVSIGTSTFLLTKDTQYDSIKSTDLKLDLNVIITGEVRDDKKTYALTISPADDTATDTTVTTPTSDNSPDQTSTDTKSSTDTQSQTNTSAPQ